VRHVELALYESGSQSAMAAKQGSLPAQIGQELSGFSLFPAEIIDCPSPNNSTSSEEVLGRVVDSHPHLPNIALTNIDRCALELRTCPILKH
jgi:hypothetical protein